MAPSTVCLVSGSNRGIGLGLVTEILNKHDTAFVYAAARNPEAADRLHELQSRHPERLAIVKLESADVDGARTVARQIEERHGRVDTVIANAAIGEPTPPVSEIDPESLNKHFRINVTGPVILFQSMYQLLKKSSHPRFIPISSIAGGLDGLGFKLPLQNTAYGISKAALNWVTRKIHFENEWLTTFPFSPGAVETDMLQQGKAASSALRELVENYGSQSVSAASVQLLKVIDESTREEEGGEFVNVDGTRLPW